MTRIFLALCLLPACSELNLDMASELRTGDAASQDTGGGADESALIVVDILPSGDAHGALPQSFIIDGESRTGLDLELAPTIDISGTILGFSATPMLPTVGVPGDSNMPIAAQVSITQENSIAGQLSHTDEDGQYSLRLPAGTAYQGSVVPEDPVLLPFFTLPDETFTESTTLDVDLPYGVAVHGTVQQSDGSALPATATVVLIDPVTGVMGARAAVGDRGEYMLRALPGTLELTLLADSTGYIPSVRRTVEILEGDSIIQQDLDVGILEPTLVQGTLTSPSGVTLSGGLVRFKAIELESAHGSLTIVTKSITNGAFLTQLLPGRWSVEFIPPYDADSDLSPLGMELEVSEDEVHLGTIKLPGRVSIFSQVLDADLIPQAGVIVTAREMGFDGYTYSATSSANGELRLAVPPVPLTISMMPPDSESAITWFDLISPDSASPEFMLERGQILEGYVRLAGDPVSHSLVEIRDGLNHALGTTLTDEDGHFAVRLQMGSN